MNLGVNILLANIIKIFHICIILFVLITPITDISYYLILHITLCVSLIVHWISNNNICSLSIFESQLRGIEYTKSFTHQFIGPMYDISNTSWSNISYTLTILVMFISLYKLYNSGTIGETYRLYKKLRDEEYSLINVYSICMKKLFTSTI